MIAAILRVIALRPLLTFAVLGIPVILLIAVGLLTIMALKVLFFVVLPVVVIVWALRKLFGPSTPPPPAA